RLIGSAWTEETVLGAMDALETDFQPITDWRASADYRLRVSKNLLMRLYVETTDAQAETRMVGDRRLAHA
ncbi:MAG: xanthine dehydrogenase small subunit, partial [Alphaproteobacteria bacterium]